MPAYVPPALRGSGAPPAARSQERIWTVRLAFSSGGPFNTEECPQHLIVAAADGGDTEHDTVSMRICGFVPTCLLCFSCLGCHHLKAKKLSSYSPIYQRQCACQDGVHHWHHTQSSQLHLVPFALLCIFSGLGGSCV